MDITCSRFKVPGRASNIAELRDPPTLPVIVLGKKEEGSIFPSVVEAWLLIYPPNKIIHEGDGDNSQLRNQSAIRKGERMLESFLVILCDRLGNKETGQYKDNSRTGTA